MAEPVVSVRGLTKQYGSQLAVDDLTFALEAGTITGFLGPNGAGKSTTLRLLLGLARPTAGEALADAREAFSRSMARGKNGKVVMSVDHYETRSALLVICRCPPRLDVAP